MMRRIQALVLGGVLVLALTHCASQDPDIRRGDMFYKNRKWYEAFQAYEKAVLRDAKLLETVPGFRENFKNAYYYHGGSIEMEDGPEAAIKYYVKGFDLIPTDVGMCDKLAKYYWQEEDFENAAKYFGRLVELDAEAPDGPKKFQVLGDDYYALGYSLYQMKKLPEAKEALQQSLKAAPKGQFAAKAKSALDAVKFDMSKK